MKRILSIALALFAFVAVSAQEAATTGNLEAKVTELETRLAKNEKRAAAWEKAKQYFKITSFVQGMYEWANDKNSTDLTGVSTFSIRRARMSITGDLYKGKKGAVLDYRFYFDLARIKNNSNPNPILDMWVRYRPFKEFGIQFGQYKNPVTFEASISPSKYEFIDYSYAICNLAKMGSDDVAGLNVTARDMGFQFIGGFIHRDGYSIINYNVGVLNGNGLNLKDNNKSKDVYGVLTIKPSAKLSLATFYQWGEANLAEFFSEEKIQNEYGWYGNPEYVTMHRWGVGFKYDGDGPYARGEYVAGTTGKLVSEGAYLAGGYKFKLPKNAGRIWTGVMADYFCKNCFDYTNRDTANAAINTRYSVCVGYEPIKYFHFQVAYSLEQRIHHTFSNNRHFNNGIKLLATIIF